MAAAEHRLAAAPPPPYPEVRVEDARVSVLYPSERGEWWAPNHSTCFACGDGVEGTPSVMWAGAGDSGAILLHTDCAWNLGAHLIADARESALAGGNQRMWRERAIRLVRERLERGEVMA